MRRATLALAALVGVAPLLCLRGFYDAANLPQSAWIAVAGWVWLAAALLASRAPLADLSAPVLLVLLWSGLSLVWAEWRVEGWRLWLHWVSCAAIAAGARRLWRTHQDALPVLTALAASGGVVAAIGLAQHFLGFGLFPQAIAPSATFVNKNVGAGFVLLTWPLAAGLLLGASRARSKVALGATLGLEALYLLFAFSRSVWLALGAQFLCVLLFAAWRRPVRQRRLLVTGALLAIGVALLLGPRLPGVAGEAARHLAAAGRALTGEATDDVRVVSARGRLAVWANTLAMIRERPALGLGLAGHARAYPRYAHAARADPLFSERQQLDFVHNDFLQVAAEQGLVGLALWLLALAAAAQALWPRLRGGAPEGQRLAGAAGLLLVGLCVDACFSFPLERALPPLLVALSLAAALAPATKAPRRAPLALPVAALVVGLGLAALFGRWLRADRQTAVLFAALARRDAPAARRAGERALQLEPTAFAPAFLLGRLSLDEARPAEALTFLNRALSARPFDPASLGTRAEAWGAVGDLERAIADARRVADLLPREAGARYELGRWLERAGRAAQAREVYLEAALLAPARADVQIRLAVAALRSGARDVALQAAQAALSLDPRAPLAHKLLGLTLLDDPDRRAEGLEHLRSALALDPQISDAARLRALLSEADRRQ